jgi:hypothetical protein
VEPERVRGPDLLSFVGDRSTGGPHPPAGAARRGEGPCLHPQLRRWPRQHPRQGPR